MSWNPPPGSLLPRDALIERGVHPRRLASSEFHHPLPRHYTPSSAPAPLGVVARVLRESLLPGAVISHATAAELLGWPIPARLTYARTGVLHCRVAPGASRRAGSAVRVHRALPRASRRFRGLELASIADILCDLASDLTHVEMVSCMDHIVGPTSIGPLVSRETLGDLLAVDGPMSGLAGIAKVRSALPDVRALVESPRETFLRLALLREGFPEPDINIRIWAPGCRAPYRLDLAYRDLRIAIEYDGDWHRTDQERFQRDRRKDDVLHEYGWRVVRVTSNDLLDPAPLVARLEHLGVPRRAPRVKRSRARSRSTGGT